MIKSKGNLFLKNKMSGFTLIELGLYLLTAGLLTTAFTHFAKVSINQKNRLQTAQSITNLKTRIIDYAIRNNRLPCADNNTDGLEDCLSLAAGTGVPYKTLQLNQAPISSAGGVTIYSPNPLLIVKVNIDNPEWNLLVKDKDDFCLLIRNSMTTFNAAYPAIINNGTNCSAATKTYPAFILADSGKLDSDRSGNIFDGQNSEANNCYESPMRGASNNYDDTVITLGKAALAGMVCN